MVASDSLQRDSTLSKGMPNAALISFVVSEKEDLDPATPESIKIIRKITKYPPLRLIRVDGCVSMSRSDTESGYLTIPPLAP